MSSVKGFYAGDIPAWILTIELIEADFVFVALTLRLIRSLAVGSGDNRSARWRSKVIRWGGSLSVVSVNIATAITHLGWRQIVSQEGIMIYIAIQVMIMLESTIMCLLSAREARA